MGLFSKLFGKKEKADKVRSREDQPDVVDVKSEDEAMNWAMEKSRLTLHYFKNCLKNPHPSQQYFSVKVRIEDNGMIEHIWLTEPSFDEEGNLFGVVGNEPIDVKSVKFNQKIGIDNSLVSDWMILENGRLIGGYTIRVVRDKLSGQALQNFDNGLGGMFIDHGEDYFLADDSTPEGAIVKIEEAYREKDLDKIKSCKDFRAEAVVMLDKLGKMGMGGELIDQTAELLELSFVKSIQEHGMPVMNHVKQSFPVREKVSDNHMIITEVCYYPDGGTSIQRLNTFKSENGWKVMNPVD